MKQYSAVLDYLHEWLPMFQRLGGKALKKDLHNILALCTATGNPHRAYPSVHIGGTNGKGSTAHILAAILKQAGYKVGLYTSPHYLDFRERIKINGKLVPKENIVHFVNEYKETIEKLQPSFFEITVAMAFDCFAKYKVDIAIVEVGLGGRLDSTNVLNPLVVAITNIGLDHQDVLGDTLALIAEEKAGIIKQDTPVVIGESHPETRAIFQEKAIEKNAPIRFADQELEIEAEETDSEYVYYTIKNKKGAIVHKNLALGLKGAYQKHNLRVALLVLDELRKKSWKVNRQSVLMGTRHVVELSRIMGRWQQLGTEPTVIADSAHNAHGLQYVAESLKAMKYNKLHLVLGFSKEKNLNEVFPLLPKEASYYFCKPNQPRGLTLDSLLAQAKGFDIKGKAYASVQAAYQAAKRRANKKDLIFVGGSIFVLAEIL